MSDKSLSEERAEMAEKALNSTIDAVQNKAMHYRRLAGIF
jgi:hypothetical protein